MHQVFKEHAKKMQLYNSKGNGCKGQCQIIFHEKRMRAQKKQLSKICKKKP